MRLHELWEEMTKEAKKGSLTMEPGSPAQSGYEAAATPEKPKKKKAPPAEQLAPEAMLPPKPETPQAAPQGVMSPEQMMQQQMMAEGQMPMAGPAPQTLPGTANAGTRIGCESNCKYAQNPQHFCQLNQILLDQIKENIFQCKNYEDIGQIVQQ